MTSARMPVPKILFLSGGIIRIRLHMYNLGTSYGPGISFATDDANPSHHFAQETPSPTILLA